MVIRITHWLWVVKRGTGEVTLTAHRSGGNGSITGGALSCLAGSLRPAPGKADLFEFGHGPLEPRTRELAAAQGGPEISPIEDLCADGRQRRGDARRHQQPLDIGPPSAVDLIERPRRGGVGLAPGAHADFDGGAVSERVA